MGLLSGLGKVVKGVVGSVTGGDILSAGAGLLGGFMDNRASARNAATANAFTEEQLKNRHQWEVADLRKAGLNPILSAGGTPSIGASAKADTFSATDRAIDSVNSAAAVRRQRAETQNIQEDTQLKKSAQTLQGAQTAAAITQSKANMAAAANSAASAASYNQDVLTKQAQLPAVIANSANSAKEANTWINKYIRPRTKAFADMLGDYTGMVGNVFRGSASHNTISK